MIDDLEPYRSNNIRRYAKGQHCQLQLNGYCNNNPKTTVLAHAPSLFKGISLKGNDFWSIFSCSSCHDVIDGRIKHNLEEDYIQFKCYSAIEKTLYILFKDRIVSDR